jgi:hypothetical protein
MAIVLPVGEFRTAHFNSVDETVIVSEIWPIHFQRPAQLTSKLAADRSAE